MVGLLDDWLTPGNLNRTLTQVNWLLLRSVQARDGYEAVYLQLRHSSVRDFLVSEEYDGPARLGLPAMHAHVAEHYLRQAERSTWAGVEPYGRYYAVRHMIESQNRRQSDQAAKCLSDLEYLQATLGEEAAE